MTTPARELAHNDALAELHEALDGLWHALQSRRTPRGQESATRTVQDERQGWGKSTLPKQMPCGLKELCSRLSLSAFERQVILLCAGAEIDPRFPALYAEISGHPKSASPTFALAFEAWGEARWEAVPPSAALRRWTLVVLNGNESVLRAPLALDERILFYLTGAAADDGRLVDVFEPYPATARLSDRQQSLAGELASLWRTPSPERRPVLCQVFGSRRSERRNTICAAADKVGRPLRLLNLAVLSRHPARDALATLLARESLLTGALLCVETEGNDQSWDECKAFVMGLPCDVAISCRHPLPSANRPCLRFELSRDDIADLHARWHAAFGPVSEAVADSIDRVATQFALDSDEIDSVNHSIKNSPSGLNGTELSSLLWNTCRCQARRSLDGLATRVESRATWEDLILPEAKMATLRGIAAQVAQRARVYGEWGFAAKCSRGLGITALFAGDSGTGKTLAAEVIANHLELDLFRIDLSQVVSKYIGETEKNLNRVFDAADDCGAVLLFDEADALFGKRSEVKDSHDRYANIEVSFLLQRMEAYRGLAIMTTNRKSAIDTAFTRRIRFIVDFPFPDTGRRAAIWRRAFPANAPTVGLGADRLARLNATGGQISNIALLAAFIAADEHSPITIRHIARAAKYEFGKTDRPFAESELGEIP